MDRKRAQATRINLGKCAAEWGHATALLTITFAEDLPTKEANIRRANFARRVLKSEFGEWVTVREFTKRGRPHFHLLIDCRGDVSTGYNWEHHDAVTAWSKAGREGPKPLGALNRTPRLRELHQLLNEKAKKYKLGRLELVPIRKAEAIGFYLGGYLSKSLEHAPASARGTRSVNYSAKCPRVAKGQWSWANPSAWLWRAKLRTWADKHGCASMSDVASLFGPRWAYHHREAIMATKLSYYPTHEHARRDGIYVPDGTIDITITTTGKSVSDRLREESDDVLRGTMKDITNRIVSTLANTPHNEWVHPKGVQKPCCASETPSGAVPPNGLPPRHHRRS